MVSNTRSAAHTMHFTMWMEKSLPPSSIMTDSERTAMHIAASFLDKLMPLAIAVKETLRRMMIDTCSAAHVTNVTIVAS